jgi:acylpyruvate hydrolase
MRLGTVDTGDRLTAVVFRDTEPIPVPFGDVRELLEAGEAGLNTARSALSDGAALRDGWRWRRPILEPGATLCVGLNYRSYLADTGREAPAAPVWFDKLARSLTDPDVDVALPALDGRIDYEGELAVVIGTTVRDIASSEAWAAVAGITLFNDVTARGLAKDRGQLFYAKNLERASGMGPVITTLDEIEDFESLRFELTVNGEHRQFGDPGDLAFDVSALIADLTALTTLHPGDVIATGTPAGLAMNFTPPRWLTDGDVVELSCPAIGVLRNRFVTASHPRSKET